MLLGLAVLVLSVGRSRAIPRRHFQCPPNSIIHYGVCYFESLLNRSTNPISTCPNNSKLAIIDTNSLATQISSALIMKLSNTQRNRMSLYVGLARNRSLYRRWQWINGKEFDPASTKSLKWLPSNHPYSDCGTLNIHRDGISYFSDNNCDDSKFGLCELVFDQCSKHDNLCGSRGRCLSESNGHYKCICSFFSRGTNCDQRDYNAVQSCVAFVLILLIFVSRPMISGKLPKLGLISQLESFKTHENRSEDPDSIIYQSQDSLYRSKSSKKCDDRKNHGLQTSNENIIIILIAGAVSILISILLYRFQMPDIHQFEILTNSDFVFVPAAVAFVCYDRFFDLSENRLPSVWRSNNDLIFLYGILSHQVLILFKHIILRSAPGKSGVLVELCKRIGLVGIVGLKYYPVSIRLSQSNDPTHKIANSITFAYLFIDLVQFVWKTATSTNGLTQSYKTLRALDRFKQFPFLFCLTALIFSFGSKMINRDKNQSEKFERSTSLYLRSLFKNQLNRSRFVGHSSSGLLVITVGVVVSLYISVSLIQIEIATGNAMAFIFARLMNLFPAEFPIPSLRVEFLISVLLCQLTFSVQLLSIMRSMRIAISRGYKGQYSSTSIYSRLIGSDVINESLHFSGYTIGYLVWSYLTLLTIMFIIVFMVHASFRFPLIAGRILARLTPFVVLFGLKRFLLKFMMTLTTPVDRSFLNFFSFFFDCFLSGVSCVASIAKALIVTIVCLPRLDFPMFGRALEHWDRGYVAYVCFVKTEANKSNPVKEEFVRVAQEKIGQVKKDKIDQRKQYLRFKWNLLYTLERNESVRKMRKKPKNVMVK